MDVRDLFKETADHQCSEISRWSCQVPEDDKRTAERSSGPIPKDPDGVGHVPRRDTLRHGEKTPAIGQRHWLGDRILYP